MRTKEIIRQATARVPVDNTRPVHTEATGQSARGTVVYHNPTPRSAPVRGRKSTQTHRLTVDPASLGLDERTARALTHTWR